MFRVFLNCIRKDQCKTQILFGKTLVCRFPNLLLLPRERNKTNSFAFDIYMVKSQEIKFFFLGIVYLVLLSSVILPHHHHEELACYTSTHCEEDLDSHQRDANEIEDHHHDQNSNNESEHCITIDYYVVTNAGKNIKHISIPVLLDHGHVFFSACSGCLEGEPELAANNILSESIPITSSYSEIIRKELPLRAPPSNIA